MAQRAIEGRRRRILGITAAGVVIPVIKGREDPDPNRPSDDPEGHGNGDGGDGGTGDPGTGGEGSQQPPGKLYTEDEIQALMRRMQAADRTAAEAQKKVQQYEDKDKTELEKLQRDHTEAMARAEKAEAELMKTRIHNKFLASNKYQWHDPETALALLNLENLEIGDDGKISGLEKAIEDLAKAKPFLVNSNADKQESGKPGGGRPSGSQPPANGTGGKDRDKDRARLLEKYPALNR